MTKAERTLVDSGEDTAVLETRGKYQETMRRELCMEVEALTGRRVVAFISGSNIDPDISAELFILDGLPGTMSAEHKTHAEG